jgi:hypothetical protein
LSERKKVERDLEIDKLFVEEIAAAIIPKIRGILPDSHIMKPESIDRCMARLRIGPPIGAQGESRQFLRELLATYRGNRGGSDTDRQSKFREVLAQFDEQPVQMDTLLWSCAKRRQEIICDAVSGWTCGAQKIDIDSLCGSLAEVDTLVVKSISSSMIHERLIALKKKTV